MHTQNLLREPTFYRRDSFKGYYKISLYEKCRQLTKNSNFDMIIINIGILIYPVKDSAERGIVFSKNSFFLIFYLGSQINNCEKDK